jgi:DNA-binding CsgD family transcriptional regulator
VGTRLVGRDEPLAALDELRRAALAGEGAVALVTGEAGIGKSALAEAAAARAAADGMAVLAGRAVVDEGAPAFWPWLRALGQGERQGLDPGLLDLKARGGPDPSVARFQAIEDTVAALRAAAAPAGLLVVLEDLQWADDGSLRLLHRLATELGGARLLVLGTLRDPDRGRRLPEALGDLAAQPAVRTLPVAALRPAEIAEYLGAQVHRTWPGQLHRLSGGNPLYVRELARLLGRDGRLAKPATDLDLPVELRRLVVQRMSQLSPACRGLVGACAVAGEEIDASLARTLADDADALLAEAVAAGVLVDDPLTPATLRFSHDLVRRATYAELARAERIAWHRRIADALTDRGRPGEVATHRVRAAVDPAERRAAVEACAAAGADAARGLDPSRAAAWYGQALDLLDGDPERRAELLVARAEAAFVEGRFASALDDCAAAMDAAPNRPDVVASAAVVVRGYYNDPTVLTLCDRAEAVLGGEDSGRHAQVLAQRAFVLAQSGRIDEADAVSRRAMEMAERSGDPIAVVGAVHARHQVAGAPEGVTERLALGTRMIELAGAVGRFDTAMWGHLWRIDAAYQLGQLGAVDTEMVALTALTERRGGPLARWHLTRARAARAAIVGQFGDALRLAGEARDIAAGMQDYSGIGMYWALVTSFVPFVGGPEGVDAQMALLENHPAADMAITTASTAYALSTIGELDAAADWFARFRRHLDGLPRDLLWMPVVALGGEAAAALGDQEFARRCYELLLPYAGYHLQTVTAMHGAVPRSLGVMAFALGEVDAAERHLADAVAMDDRMGALPCAALARYEHARVLSTRGGPGDRDRALAAAERALAAGRRLDLPRITGLASALADELSGVRGGAGTLTAREREIAALVAAGLANRVIAEKLVLSERTVETHVRNLLAKLGLANRTQVAAWAARAGIRTRSA